jgi:hypothetical protein
MNEKRFQDIVINPEGGSSSRNKHPSKLPKRDKKEPLLTRRDFLKLGGAALGAYALGKVVEDRATDQKVKEISENLKREAEKTQPQSEPEQVGEEKKPEALPPLEQLRVYGEVRNLEEGLEMVRNEHYIELTETEEGLKDMQTAVQNIKRYNLKKLIDPFLEKGFPKELAYIIAIQETRGRVQKSSAGARGVTGLMPATVKALGYEPEDADDPYHASKMTAQYLATEREERFGKAKDDYILLHAYNAGGGLFGFTEKTPKEKRTCKNFYRYMEEYINSRYRETKERGYRHILDDEDSSLDAVSKRFQVPLRKLLKANGFTENTIIHEGDSVLIPFEDLDQAAKIIFRKPLEALQYVPEVKAKYNALQDKGLLSELDG